MVALINSVCFLFFLRELMVQFLVWCFGGLFVSVVSRYAEDKPMSLIFRKVHRPSLLSIRQISITSVLSKLFERLVSVGLRRFMERSGVFQLHSLLIHHLVPVMHYCACPTLQNELECGQGLGSCRLIFQCGI